jgi:hypothetical protein
VAGERSKVRGLGAALAPSGGVGEGRALIVRGSVARRGWRGQSHVLEESVVGRTDRIPTDAILAVPCSSSSEKISALSHSRSGFVIAERSAVGRRHRD